MCVILVGAWLSMFVLYKLAITYRPNWYTHSYTIHTRIEAELLITSFEDSMLSMQFRLVTFPMKTNRFTNQPTDFSISKLVVSRHRRHLSLIETVVGECWNDICPSLHRSPLTEQRARWKIGDKSGKPWTQWGGSGRGHHLPWGTMGQDGFTPESPITTDACLGRRPWTFPAWPIPDKGCATGIATFTSVKRLGPPGVHVKV